MQFRNARPDEADIIYALYKSVVGSKFCSWNEFYPGTDEIRHDLEASELYVMTENDIIIGACSVVPENELSGFGFWTVRDGTERELARVVIAKARQGNGIAAEMVSSVLSMLKSRGCRAVHLAVNANNIPAYKTYMKTGFHRVGESDMYNGHYFLLEKMI